MINRKLIKVVYKIDINKILKVNKVINKALKQLVAIVMKQIHSFFNKYIKESIQSTHLKKVLTIML